MGLAPIFVERIFETIVEINKQGTTILLVEQNAMMALDVANRGYVLETGTSRSPTTRRRCAGTSRCASRTSARTEPEPTSTRSGKYGRASRKPIAALAAGHAARHLERRADAVRRDEAELPRGDRVAAAGDDHGAERGPSAGGTPSQSANGSSGWQVRPAGRPRSRARRAAATRSASASALRVSGPSRVAWKNARYGCCVGWAKWRWKRWSRIAVPPSTTGNASRQSRSASPSPRYAREQRVRPLARQVGRRPRDRRSRSRRAARRASPTRSSTARSSASACATDGGPRTPPRAQLAAAASGSRVAQRRRAAARSTCRNGERAMRSSAAGSYG